jgi:hypothetical protein
VATVMLVSFTVVLHGYFHRSGSSLRFWNGWRNTFAGDGRLFPLPVVYPHSADVDQPISKQVIGLFYFARADIPAMLAMLTTVVTTINFVTSVEIAFYPKYRQYFGLQWMQHAHDPIRP